MYGVDPEFGRKIDVDLSEERMKRSWEAYKIRWEREEERIRREHERHKESLARIEREIQEASRSRVGSPVLWFLHPYRIQLDQFETIFVYW